MVSVSETEIGQQVDRLNKSLLRVDELNAEILAQRSSGRDATALMDERQTLVDTISEIVPVREVARDHNQISLYTTGGAILLEVIVPGAAPSIWPASVEPQRDI